MDINRIAEYMVTKGAEETTENNFIFYVDELAEKFNVTIEKILQAKSEIMETVEEYEDVVSCVDFVDDGFQLYFWFDTVE